MTGRGSARALAGVTVVLIELVAPGSSPRLTSGRPIIDGLDPPTAKLQGAYLTGAHLSHADLSGANLAPMDLHDDGRLRLRWTRGIPAELPDHGQLSGPRPSESTP